MPTTWEKRERVDKLVGYDADFVYDDNIPYDGEYFGSIWTERNPI